MPDALSHVPDRAGAVFGALSDPTRRALLAAIAQERAVTATELASELPISRQAVLKHLNALASAGLLDRERSGREVRYRVTPEPLSDAVGWMADVGSRVPTVENLVESDDGGDEAYKQFILPGVSTETCTEDESLCSCVNSDCQIHY